MRREPREDFAAAAAAAATCSWRRLAMRLMRLERRRWLHWGTIHFGGCLKEHRCRIEAVAFVEQTELVVAVVVVVVVVKVAAAAAVAGSFATLAVEY